MSIIKRKHNEIVEADLPKPLHPEGSLVRADTPDRPWLNGQTGVVRSLELQTSPEADYYTYNVELSPGHTTSFAGRELRRHGR